MVYVNGGMKIWNTYHQIQLFTVPFKRQYIRHPMTQDLIRDLVTRTASLLNMIEADPTNPWYSAYPNPRNVTPERITRADLLQRMQTGQKSGVDFLLVDLRWTDHEVGRNFV
jgi:hypothetical protein